jgi:hypothetical protein
MISPFLKDKISISHQDEISLTYQDKIFMNDSLNRNPRLFGVKKEHTS